MDVQVYGGTLGPPRHWIRNQVMSYLRKSAVLYGRAVGLADGGDGDGWRTLGVKHANRVIPCSMSLTELRPTIDLTGRCSID